MMAVRATNTNSYRSTDRRTGTNTYERSRRQHADSNVYVYGNTVRQLDVQRQLEEPLRRPLSREAQINRAKAKHMNLGYVMFLVAALAMAAVILISYVRVQAEITTVTEYITVKEKELNHLKVANDEAMTRIESRLNLEEIKKVAIGELGMTYPVEGQIISYEVVDRDYVRRVTEEE